MSWRSLGVGWGWVCYKAKSGPGLVLPLPHVRARTIASKVRRTWSGPDHRSCQAAGSKFRPGLDFGSSPGSSPGSQYSVVLNRLYGSIFMSFISYLNVLDSSPLGLDLTILGLFGRYMIRACILESVPPGTATKWAVLCIYFLDS